MKSNLRSISVSPNRDYCVSCGDEWKNREITRYDTGATSISIISGMQLISNHGKKRIQLMFCDKHSTNPGFRHVVRYVNGTGVLQIRNVKSNRWRNAEKVGVVV